MEKQTDSWVYTTEISLTPPPGGGGHLGHFLLGMGRWHLRHFWANDFLNLKVPKKCDSIQVTLLKMPEKATPL